jgi:hypothetical protein
MMDFRALRFEEGGRKKLTPIDGAELHGSVSLVMT